VSDDEGDLLTSQSIPPAGNTVLPGADAEELSDLFDGDVEQPEEYESEEQVIAEDSVLKSHPPPLASLRYAQEINVSELYGDMEVDVHGYDSEEPSKKTGMLSVHYKTRSF
jgi:hypothetical protein